VHKDEAEVKKIIQSDGTRQEIQVLWDLLRNKGDNTHNMKVIEEGKGELILGRRPSSSTVKLENYGPCPGCLHWLHLDIAICKHQKTCPAIEDFNSFASKGELLIQSLYISGRLQSKASTALTNDVFPVMIDDGITKTAQTDPLIVSLGNILLTRNVRNKLKQKYCTSSRMREAARLLANARTILNSDCTMSELLKPEHFDDVAKAALITASPGFDDEEDLKSPSTAIRLRYEIKRMLNVKWAEGIKGNNEVTVTESKSFLKLLKSEWSTKVTNFATRTLQVRMVNKDKSHPEPGDIIAIQKKIQEAISNFDVKDISPQNFRLAEEMTQVRLLLYNKRRSGEIESMR
jgi:hypothetical protein